MPILPAAIAATLVLAVCFSLSGCAHRQNGDYWAGVASGVAHVENGKR